MSAALKECPFCGAAMPATYSNVVDGKMHAIQCTECPGGVTCTSSTFEQAVGAWNRRAIAPPVAAGSVDTEEFRNLLEYWVNSETEAYKASELGNLISHINAWGAQQRRAGEQHAADIMFDAMDGLRKRAEKAEAELRKIAKAQAELQEKFDKQGAEFCVTALKLRDAESRLRPMEAYFRMMCLEIPKPFGTPIDPSDKPC